MPIASNIYFTTALTLCTDMAQVSYICLWDVCCCMVQAPVC